VEKLVAGIVVLSDTHFSNRKQFGKTLTNPVWKGCNSRFHEIAYAVQRAFKYALDNDCEAIVIPGDIFHERGFIQVPVYNAVYEIFDQIANQSKVRLIIMPGNHDMVDAKALGGSDGLHSLFAMNNMTLVIEKPTWIPLNSFDLFSVPYDSTPKFKKADEARPRRKLVSLLFLHQSIEGAETGPTNWRMPHELKVSELEDLGYDLVISGHYHKHQSLSKTVHYCGALLQHDFGERDYVPGWMHVTPDGEWKHIEDKESPRFVQITTDSKNRLSFLNPKNYNNIIWTGEEPLSQTEENMVVTNQPIVETRVVRSTIKTTDSIREMITKYVEIRTGQRDASVINYLVEKYEGVKK
jgi:DNA repair exonuclease SbcCD nuclease subunit